MTVETKFAIGDLTQRRYDKGTQQKQRALEIMETIVQVCYGGTQVFYLARAIIAEKKEKFFSKEDDDKREWSVGHGLSTENGVIAFQKYREDELIPCSEETKAIITGP